MYIINILLFFLVYVNCEIQNVNNVYGKWKKKFLKFFFSFISFFVITVKIAILANE